MSLNPRDLLEVVVRPALEAIGAGGAAAEQLVMGTAALESKLIHLRQVAHADGRRGPALGLWQMEPATFTDLWTNYLAFKEPLRQLTLGLATVAPLRTFPEPIQLCWNFRFAAAMCRVHYLRAPFKMMEPGNVAEMERVHKKYYNTPLGATKPGEFTAAYRTLVAPLYD